MKSNYLYKIFEAVEAKVSKGEDIIKLNVGEPEIDPPKPVLDGLLYSIKNKRFKYGQADGDHALRQSLAYEYGVKKENIVIGPGSKFLIYAFLKNILKTPRDEVIIPTPYWSAFTSMLLDLGITKIRYLPTTFESGWQFTANQLDNY